MACKRWKWSSPYQDDINSGSAKHLSAFHSQQSIEKTFKALLEEFDLGFIKTHSLETLFNKVKDLISAEIDTDMLTLLDQLYIDARYPGELGLLPNGKPSIAEAKKFYFVATQLHTAAENACR